MKQYLSYPDSSPPDLVLAYAQSIYEMALFAERNGIWVSPQKAIMTSAGTLYPFMREKIEEVFRHTFTMDCICFGADVSCARSHVGRSARSGHPSWSSRGMVNGTYNRDLSIYTSYNRYSVKFTCMIHRHRYYSK